MLKRVLCVDDEPNILQGFERQLRKHFDVETALGPERGLEAISTRGPFAAVVSDLRMPGMDGTEFLARVKQLAPDTVRLMLTGQAELATTIAAVNRGSVFQFLTKPCPTEILVNALEAALEQHRLITAERELLEQTLRRTIGVLTEILSLTNPLAFSRAQHIRHYVRHLSVTLDLPDQWQYELAAMLSQIGCIAIPPEILEKIRGGDSLDAGETSVINSQSRIASDLLTQIPRLELVAQMVARQREPWSARGQQADRVAVGAQLLKIAQDFDDALLRGGDVDTVLNNMIKRAEYYPEFVAQLQQVEVAQDAMQTRILSVNQLRIRMIIDADVFSKGGLLLLAKGQEITASAILRLHNFAATVGVVEPIHVVVPFVARPEAAHIEALPLPPSFTRPQTGLAG